MGEVFAGRFELVEPIAEGGMGSVWVVHDHRDGQRYAGKLLRQSDSASLMRFMREQSTRIQHPHVVTPISWAGEDDRVLFTMPLVRGGSVADLLRQRGALEPPLVVTLLDQALRGLEAVHALGVVHRDIKPGNLLLEPAADGRPHLLLTDFGISTHVDEPRLTRASQVIGSPGYMAPEQLAGADPALAQDLFAVGMVGLEMVTGRRPPDCVEEARGASDTLRDLLLRAVSNEVSARPTSAADFRRALAELDVPGAEGFPEQVVQDRYTTGETLPPPSGAAPTLPSSAGGTRVDDRHAAVTEPSARQPGPRPVGPPGPAHGDTARSGIALVAAGVVLLLAAVLVALLG